MIFVRTLLLFLTGRISIFKTKLQILGFKNINTVRAKFVGNNDFGVYTDCYRLVVDTCLDRTCSNPRSSWDTVSQIQHLWWRHGGRLGRSSLNSCPYQIPDLDLNTDPYSIEVRINNCVEYIKGDGRHLAQTLIRTPFLTLKNHNLYSSLNTSAIPAKQKPISDIRFVLSRI